MVEGQQKATAKPRPFPLPPSLPEPFGRKSHMGWGEGRWIRASCPLAHDGAGRRGCRGWAPQRHQASSQGQWVSCSLCEKHVGGPVGMRTHPLHPRAFGGGAQAPLSLWDPRLPPLLCPAGRMTKCELGDRGMNVRGGWGRGAWAGRGEGAGREDRPEPAALRWSAPSWFLLT